MAHMLNVRLSDDEWEVLLRRVAESGLSRSSYARRRLVGDPMPPSPPDPPRRPTLTAVNGPGPGIVRAKRSSDVTPRPKSSWTK